MHFYRARVIMIKSVRKVAFMPSEKFTVKFAETEKENNGAYALRYRDMLCEYRPELLEVDGTDIGPADAYARQVICIDNETNEVVGCYRLILSVDLPKGKRFVCEEEFDISQLKETGAKIAELSRAVVKKEYRNSIVLMLILRFITCYLRKEGFRFIIGEASFFGTDKKKWQKELSYLAHYYANGRFGVTSLEKEQVEILAKEELDVTAIKRSLPPLMRAYIGFGATVSADSFTDWDFGSVDVFILVDFQNYNEAYVNRLLRINE